MQAPLEKRIKEVLNQEDIEGLVALGAPDDEYEREAGLIHRAIRDVVPTADGGDAARDAMKRILKEVWSESFGPFSHDDLTRRESAFERAAARIAGFHFE